MHKLKGLITDKTVSRAIRAWAFGALVLIIIGITTFIAEDLFLAALKGDWKNDFYLNVMKLVGFAFLVPVLLLLILLATKLSGRILGLNVKDRMLVPGSNDRLTDVKGMVAFLSSPWAGKKGKHEEIIQAIREGRLTIKDIVKGDILDLGEKDEWNWQPLLTSLYVCSGGSEKLRAEIMTSTVHKDARGSDPHFSELEEVVSLLMPDDVDLQNSAFSLDAKSPRSVSGGLELALDMLRASGVKDKEIVIELTGGPATMSALGAIFALQDGLRAIYSANRKGKAIMPIVFTPSVTFFSDLQI